MTGYGSQALALKYLGVDFESYKVIEFDKSVIKSYNEIHNTNFIATDIKDVDKLECDHTYLNICTYSYPCQSISKAGKGEGMAKGSGTRSALLWEVERILKNTKAKPQVLLMENVPDVIGTNNIEDFKEWLHELEQMGYSSYVQLMNGKDYGIPQNRNRAFMVSIMGDYNYTFPSKIKLEKRLKDYLEYEVDDKYYLSDNQVKKIMNWNAYQKPLENIIEIDGIIPTITKRGAGESHSGMIIINRYGKKSVLTEKECFRLMGVKDSDSSKLTCSNSKKYHLAGNSIITTCLMAIFGQLLGLDWKPILQKTIEEIKGKENE